MEFHQFVQNRTGQTVPVINQYAPTLKVGGKGASDLGTASGALNGLAQARDNAIFASDEAVRAEYAGFLKIRLLTLKVPALIEAFLGDEDPVLDSLGGVYAMVPRTTESALSRARALRPVWEKVNTARAVMTPPQEPVARNGLGIAALDGLLATHPVLEQALENTAQKVRDARVELRAAAVDLDKLNKRFYKALGAQADVGSALAEALNGIETESANLPQTLSVKSVLQGGGDQLHVLVAYETGTFDDAATNTIEWMVQGVDAEFSHTMAADPSGNALGPFAVGQAMKLRTRVRNGNGTTTGGVRTIPITAPVV